jgi:hypothetical protein
LSQSPVVDLSAFVHVRMIIGIIVALSIGRLLSGLAVFVQHPGRNNFDAVHFIWTLFTFMSVIQLWWWEFHLSNVTWTFPVFCFVVFYASTMYFLCTLLFPDTLYEYDGFRNYFMSRRKWFFGILIAFVILDIVDTAIKGTAYLHSFGAEYWLRAGVFVLVCLTATRVESRRFHLAFAVIALLYELSWVVRRYDVLT